MKAHQPSQQSAQVKSSELFFGVLMLIIIFITSCNTSHASPKVSLESSYLEQTQDITASSALPKGNHEVKIRQQQSNVSVPALIMLLLVLSYGALSGGLYLVQEIRSIRKPVE